MAFILTVGCRRHSLRHLRHLFSPSTTTSVTETPSALSTVRSALFCRESDPTRSIATLFSFPDSSCARYAADHALHNLISSLSYTGRSDLIDFFLPLANSEQDLASLLLSYGSASLPGKALDAFLTRLAAGGSLSVSTLSFNALLSAYIRSKRHRRVPDLFFSVCDKHSVSPDVVSYGLLIKAFFLSNRSDDAFAILKKIRDEQGIVLTDQIYKLLLISLRNCGKTEEANLLWNEMVANGVKLDRDAYNVKVWYHAFRCETERVLESIREMQSAEIEGVKPDTITYNYLIGCLSKKDQVKDVKEVYKEMLKKKDCSPTAGTFINVMSCLCRNGDFEAGMEVFRDSSRSKKVPRFAVLKKLVYGLVKEGKVEAAKEVIKQVRSNARASLTSHWKEVEKELGLDSDCSTIDSCQKDVCL